MQQIFQAGFLPLEGESQSDFAHRSASVYRETNKVLSTKTLPVLAADLGFSAADLIPPAHFESAFRCLQPLDLRPDWVWGLYTRLGLPAFTAGCSWDFPQGLQFIQIHPVFRRLPRPFRLTREETIAHELIHIVRIPLKSNRFEELVAYSISTSAVRRVLAPLVQQGSDLVAFVVSALLSVLADLYLTRIPRWLGLILKLPVAGTVFIAFVRLWRTRNLFRKARATLLRLGVRTENVLPILVRLTDQEIELLASGVAPWTVPASASSLRLCLLRELYVV
jgi:hypothetical protein